MEQGTKTFVTVDQPNWLQVERIVDGTLDAMIDARTTPDGGIALRYEVFPDTLAVGRVEYMTIRERERELLTLWLAKMSVREEGK